MNLNNFLFLLAGLLLVGCASQQATPQSKTVTVEQGEEIVVAPDSNVEQESAEAVKLKSDLLAFERENFLSEKQRFEQQRNELLSELNQRDSLLSIREKELATRTFQIELREQVVDDKLAKLENHDLSASQSSSAILSNTTSTPQAQSNNVSYTGFNKNASDLKEYRYIQFVASKGGKTYNQYAYLGEVISEQIPGKNIFRYKIKGKFDDSQVSEIIATLRREGFEGAFEAK